MIAALPFGREYLAGEIGANRDVNMYEESYRAGDCAVLDRAHSRGGGYQPHVTRGVERTIVAAVGKRAAS